MNINKDKKFWLEQLVPGREQLMEYQRFMLPKHLPMVVFYLRSRIAREDTLEEDREDFESFLNILYQGLLLLDTLDVKLGMEVWALEVLFFGAFDVKKDFFLQAVTKKEFVEETVDEIERAEKSYHRQSKLIADFKFRLVKPKLRSLIERFEAELGVVEDEEREGVSGCLEILYYLEAFIHRNCNSESEHFDTDDK